MSHLDHTTGTNQAGRFTHRSVKRLTASSILGDKIYNSADEQLGEIKDIMLNIADGTIAYIVIESEEFLGTGQKYFAVPSKSLILDADRKAFILDESKISLENLPGFDKDHWSDTNPPKNNESLSSGEFMHANIRSAVFDISTNTTFMSKNNEPDCFTVLSHPEVFKEIKLMANRVSNVPGNFKREILISFLKDRSIKIDWLAGNDLLVQMIASGSLKMYHTEKLFDSRRSNKAFIADLEGCIETELIKCQYDAKHSNVLTSPSSVGSFQDQCYYACVSPSAAGNQRLFGIHEEEISKLTYRIKWRILNVMQIKKRMKSIIRTISTNSCLAVFC